MAIAEDAKLTASPGGGDVFGCGSLQAATGRPVMQVHVNVDEPVVMDREELFQVVCAAMPPVIHVAVTKPPQAQADVDRRDEPLTGQCLVGDRDDPGFQALLTGTVHEGERSRSIASAGVTAFSP